MAQFNWDKIGDNADICDLPITDKYGDDWPQWECSVAFPEDKVNGDCDSEIRICFDGYNYADGEGKVYVDVGQLDRADRHAHGQARHHHALEHRCAGRREAERRRDRPLDRSGLGLCGDPSGPGRTRTTSLTARYRPTRRSACEGIQNHNQAIRAPRPTAAETAARCPGATVGIRIHRLSEDRYVTLAFEAGDDDVAYAGNYQIASPIELDASYHIGAVALVPAASDNWTLNDGEEPDKPARDLVDNDDTIPLLDRRTSV
jgi:hypothetical protein